MIFTCSGLDSEASIELLTTVAGPKLLKMVKNIDSELRGQYRYP